MLVPLIKRDKAPIFVNLKMIRVNRMGQFPCLHIGKCKTRESAFGWLNFDRQAKISEFAYRFKPIQVSNSFVIYLV